MKFALLLSTAILLPGVAHALDAGDPAPDLTVTEWVKGEAVDMAAAKGSKVVVVEFWATWCPPCIRSIPHLSELAKEYAERDVVVIGFTPEDPNNSIDQVKEFVAKMGDNMAYTVAFEKGQETWNAWMKASGQGGIPCSFVVDKEGKVSWIGHPMAGLDRVLEKVVSGTFDLEAEKRWAKLDTEIEAARRGQNWSKLLELAAKLKELDPARGAEAEILGLFKSGKKDEALTKAKEAREARSEDAKAVLRLGALLATFDDADLGSLAIESLERAAAVDATLVEAHQLLFELAATRKDREKAELAARKFLEVVGGRGDANGLNEFAWKMLTEEPGKGAYNEIALEMGKKANELSNGENWYILDTYALALFETGAAAEAVEVEKKAIEKAKAEGIEGEDLATLQKALDRFMKAFE